MKTREKSRKPEQKIYSRNEAMREIMDKFLKNEGSRNETWLTETIDDEREEKTY